MKYHRYHNQKTSRGQLMSESQAHCNIVNMSAHYNRLIVKVLFRLACHTFGVLYLAKLLIDNKLSKNTGRVNCPFCIYVILVSNFCGMSDIQLNHIVPYQDRALYD